MKTKMHPQVTPIAEKTAVEEFVKRYEALCKEMGLQIVFQPQWAQSKDTGDYRLVILTSVQPIPKQE